MKAKKIALYPPHVLKNALVYENSEEKNKKIFVNKKNQYLTLKKNDL